MSIVKSVGFRTPVSLWYKFKAKCYEEGYDVSKVLSSMIKLFVEDEEFRARVLQKLEG